MKIWTFTTGSLHRRIRVNLLLATLAIFFEAGNVTAEETAPVLDMDMIEFLGSFETAGRNAIDPLALEENIATGKAHVESAKKRVHDKTVNKVKEGNMADE
jgi:hypothetical protein